MAAPVRLGNGRILNISSNGSYGAPAMPGYAAAKGAILSLTRTQAILGKRIGVCAPTRSPRGLDPFHRRHRAAGFGEFLQAHFPPEAVAAFAAYLLHADTTLTGEVFAVGGGLVSRVVQAETPGALTDEHPGSMVRAHRRSDDAGDHDRVEITLVPARFVRLPHGSPDPRRLGGSQGRPRRRRQGHGLNFRIREDNAHARARPRRRRLPRHP
ncbi:SDR family oxidoreductase [Rhodococcus hoagii]|nr:SDR family oxidoreductase [Prescottella equi]